MTRRFDPVEFEQMRLLGRLSPGRRRRQYPDLALRELDLKGLEEIARAGRTSPGAQPLDRNVQP